MNKSLLSVSVLSALFLSACASTANFTKLSQNTYESRPMDCNIDVLTDEPKKPHEKLGFISAVSGQTWWADKSANAMLEPMKQEACSIGADAIVVKQIEEGGVAWITATQGKANALAIRYTADVADNAGNGEEQTSVSN